MAFDQTQYQRDQSLKAAMWQFHLENPHIMKLVLRFTFEVIDAGFQHYSMSSIFERIRWHVNVETSDPDFKLNNNHKAYYARYFHKLCPDYEGFFRTRVAEDEA